MSLKIMFLDSPAKTFRKCSLAAELSYVMRPKTQANHWTKAEKKGNYKHGSQEFRLPIQIRSVLCMLLANISYATLLKVAQIMFSRDS